MSDLELRLEPKQALRISPQLLQATRMLLMPAQELSHFLERAAEENPLLERIEHRTNARGSSEPAAFVPEAGRWDSAMTSLSASLTGQLERRHLDKPTAALCRYMVELLDDNGYLDSEDMVAIQHLGIDPALIAGVREAAKQIFALPMEEKMNYYIGHSKSHKGYVPEGEEIYGSGKPDHKVTIEEPGLPALDQLEIEDKWVLSKLNTLSKEVCENLDKYEIGIAAAKIYDFIWDTYCDWYIELTKPRLNSGDEARARSAQQVLLYVLTDILKLLHPFMPFITEEIWQALPHDGEALMIARYPEYTESLAFPAEERDFEMVMNAIRAVRSRRAEMNVPPSRKAHLFITTDRQDAFRSGEIYITKLAYAEQITISSEQPADAEKMVSAVTEEAKLFMPMAELIDLDKERARLEKELEKARKNYEGQMRKLSNENFISRAPEAVVQTERERAEKARALVENLEASLKNLG